MIRSGFLFIVCLLGCASCAKEGIPILGLDDNGAFVERYVSKNQMRHELKKTTSQVAESTFTALEASPVDTSATLRTVAVGLGFNLKGGLSHIISIGVSPKIRFAFSNSRWPIIPE